MNTAWTEPTVLESCDDLCDGLQKWRMFEYVVKIAGLLMEPSLRVGIPRK